MRIVYIGSVVFSAKALEKMISIGAEVVGVVTKSESSFNSDFFDLSSIAKMQAIPFHYTTNINTPDTVNWIKELQPDVVFCFGWSNLIKKEILEISRLGVIGFHPTLLPHNKGRHPLIWAKALGLKRTGSTFFFMDEGADTGDILSQKEIEINFEDDAQILYDKMTDVALCQIEEFHQELKSNTFKRIPQDKIEGNNWRKRSIKDGLIDFRMNTSNIVNLVRALTYPYVGAHIEYKNNIIKVWKVAEGVYSDKLQNSEPGKVLNRKDSKLEIKTGDSSIWLLETVFSEFPEIGSYIN